MTPPSGRVMPTSIWMVVVFAGAVGPEEADDLTSGEAEGDAVHGLEGAVVLGEVLDLEDRWGQARQSTRWRGSAVSRHRCARRVVPSLRGFKGRSPLKIPAAGVRPEASCESRRGAA